MTTTRQKKSTKTQAPARDIEQQAAHPRDTLALAPDEISLPLPPVPTKPEDIPAFMEAYRAHVELVKLGLELDRLAADRERGEMDLDKARRSAADTARESRMREIETRRAELELAKAEDDRLRADSAPDTSMTYTFFDHVDDETVRAAISTLDEWSRRRPGAPIEVQLTSPGGFVLEGLGLYDFLIELRRRGHHLTVTTLGYAASMGSILLQAGDDRVLGASSFLMVHEVSSGMYGKITMNEERLEFSKRLQERLIEILCARSKLTPTKLKKMWAKTDVWFSAQEALDLGLIDRIAGV